MLSTKYAWIWYLGCRARDQHVRMYETLEMYWTWLQACPSLFLFFYFLKNNENGGDIVGTRPMPKIKDWNALHLSRRSPLILIFFFFSSWIDFSFIVFPLCQFFLVLSIWAFCCFVHLNYHTWRANLSLATHANKRCIDRCFLSKFSLLLFEVHHLQASCLTFYDSFFII